MKNALRLAVLSFLVLFAVLSATAYPVPDEAVASRVVKIDGANLHYLTAGHGPALVLLHGYAETSLMWKPIVPSLAQRFTVIAPDLPGIGNSSIPSSGLNMSTSARRIRDAIIALGYRDVYVVGHDIGLMVAYAYAATYPREVKRLALVDAFLPGVAGWEPIYNDPHIWHFRFYGPTPLALVRGRERLYFNYFWDDFAADPHRSIPELNRVQYTAAYARPGRMAAGFAYFAAFPQTAAAFATLAQNKLAIPVLSIGGEKSLGVALGAQTRLVASDVTVIVIKNAGHWLMEEAPTQTMTALMQFLER